MKNRLAIAAILAISVWATLHASAPRKDDDVKSRHLKLESTPICSEDPEDPTLDEALKSSRSDLAITLRLRVTPSGTVDEIRILDSWPPNNPLAERFANSVARCWRSAVYDTQALKPADFPAYCKLHLTCKAVRDSSGRRKD